LCTPLQLANKNSLFFGMLLGLIEQSLQAPGGFATEEMKNAAKDFLEESFHKLEKSEHNIRPSDEDDESA
jgi:hypothetical protein